MSVHKRSFLSTFLLQCFLALLKDEHNGVDERRRRSVVEERSDQVDDTKVTSKQNLFERVRSVGGKDGESSGGAGGLTTSANEHSVFGVLVSFFDWLLALLAREAIDVEILTFVE